MEPFAGSKKFCLAFLLGRLILSSAGCGFFQPGQTSGSSPRRTKDSCLILASRWAIDYQKPYQAAGLNKSIPWYQTLGNHDHFWLGSIPVDYSVRTDLRESYITSEVFSIGYILPDPSHIADRNFYAGVLDGSTPYGDIIKAGPTAEFTSVPTVAADPDRRARADQRRSDCRYI